MGLCLSINIRFKVFKYRVVGGQLLCARAVAWPNTAINQSVFNRVTCQTLKHEPNINIWIEMRKYATNPNVGAQKCLKKTKDCVILVAQYKTHQPRSQGFSTRMKTHGRKATSDIFTILLPSHLRVRSFAYLRTGGTPISRPGTRNSCYMRIYILLVTYDLSKPKVFKTVIICWYMYKSEMS